MGALEWHLAWGEHVEALEAWAAEGDDIPALRRRPSLDPHLTFVWDAFWALQGDRHLGFSSVGPVPFQAIDAYACRAGLGIDEFDRFRRLIGQMDGVWLKDARRRMDEAAKRK